MEDQNTHNKKVAGQVSCEQLCHTGWLVLVLSRSQRVFKLDNRCWELRHIGIMELIHI